jgi:2-isopropylmalate synthase
MTRKEVLESVIKWVGYARSVTEDVEFSAEDASRTDLDFLIEIFQAAIEAGATTLNIPDTVGYAVPGEFSEMVRTVIQKTKAGKNIIWSVHTHNDLGLAVINSLEAVKQGVRQVECTINGIGERAGHASLEEISGPERTISMLKQPWKLPSSFLQAAWFQGSLVFRSLPTRP